MRSSSALLENLIQQNYAGLDLPPLWQVIYQEALRGHHLLFKRSDVELFDAEDSAANHWLEQSTTDTLEEVIVALVSTNDLNTMVRIIDSLPRSQRRSLYSFYQRAIWLWKNYSKSRLN